MKLLTSRFGEVELETEKIITFPHGVPGFEDKKQYIILHPEMDSPFSYMQSTDDEELAFIVTNPFAFFPDYQFNLSEEMEQEIQLHNESDVMIFSIVSVSGISEEISINLLAPVVINAVEKLGKQIILDASDYQTKHTILFKEDSNDRVITKDV
jgi:flagellar assembly factor FliW